MEDSGRTIAGENVTFRKAGRGTGDFTQHPDLGQGLGWNEEKGFGRNLV